MIPYPTFFGYREKTVYDQEQSDTSSDSDAETSSQQKSTADSETLEQKTLFVPEGKRVGWKSFDNLYFEPKASLAVVQRLARDMNQQPIPLSHKALGKRLKESGLLASSKKDRNVSRVNILGRKIDVFHIRVTDFIELHRCNEDFVDQQSEELFREHEAAIKREERSERIRQARRSQVRNLMQQQHMSLLDP